MHPPSHFHMWDVLHPVVVAIRIGCIKIVGGEGRPAIRYPSSSITTEMLFWLSTGGSFTFHFDCKYLLDHSSAIGGELNLETCV